jgi:phosphatidylglycerophosphate synthase
MHKIPQKYENPIDRFIYIFVEKHSKQLEFLTPNEITTISLFFELLSIKFFIDKKYKLSAILFLIAYFYDCVDGYHARRLNMVSQFGDLYDHISDVVTILSMSYLIFSKLSGNKRIYMAAFLILLAIMLSIHMGCQEKLYNKIAGKTESNTLNIFKKACVYKPEKMMRYTKYFGCGTFFVVVSLIIAHIDKI